MKHRGLPDTLLKISHAAKKDSGEDCYCYSFRKGYGLIGVFDGCGGLGAQRHSYYSGMTEAYMASRLGAGAFYDCFRDLFPSEETGEALAKTYLSAVSDACEQLLSTYRPQLDGMTPQIKGSMVRTLPTTAAAAFLCPGKSDDFVIAPIWAGDSRVYLLTRNGLMQLTRDDTTVPDPMENLYEDGILKNILCAESKTKLHCFALSVKEPFCVLTATDGCFGYFTTPMEFEGALLETMLRSQTAAGWEEALSEKIGKIAGDDYTLCLAAYGYDSFSAMQAEFADRYRALEADYLEVLRSSPNSDREFRRKLWQSYRPQYARYLKED